MAVSLVGSNTNFSGTTGTPSVPLPAGVQSGDVLIAAMVYAAADQPVTTPTGWTAVDADLHMTGNGTVSVIWKRAGVGEGTPTWTLGTGAAVTSKSADAIVAYRGSGDPVFGARVNRATSTATTVAPSITTAAGSRVVGIFMDRVSSQTTVAGPAEQVEQAKYINGGGGGVSVLISDETRAAAGATGTRTATYGLASTAGYGVLAELAAASNLPPSVSAGASQTVAGGSTVTLTGTAAGSRVVGIFMDRVSSQTTVTGPAEQVEQAKYINGGGGGVSVLISDETRASAGATGTRTATYGLASTAGYGVLAELAAASNLPPSVSAGASQTVAGGSTVTLTGTAADSDGTIASRQWTAISYPGTTAPTLTGATTNTATFVAAAGTYVFEFAATDNGGAVGRSQTTVYATGTTIAPNRVTANPGGWVNVGGAASLQAALADGSDATYVESPAGPAGSSVTFGLPALANSTQIQVTVRGQVSAATPGITRTVDILQGSTVVASRTVVPSTSWADFVVTMTEAETAAVTDRTALAVRFSSTQS